VILRKVGTGECGGQGLHFQGWMDQQESGVSQDTWSGSSTLPPRWRWWLSLTTGWVRRMILQGYSVRKGMYGRLLRHDARR
jgi:hypothetical protein